MKGSPTAYRGGQLASHANGCGAERKNLHANLLKVLTYLTNLEKMFHSPMNKDTHIGFQSVTKQGAGLGVFFFSFFNLRQN